MRSKILSLAAVFVLVSVLVFSFASCGKEKKTTIPTQTSSFFVNDYAAVLNETDADTIYKKGVALQEATTAQAVVVTVNSLEGVSIEDYALKLGREWRIGTEDNDNGVIILLSKNDREIYIAVGYGLEGALPDSKTGRIIDNYGITYFANDNFSTGIMSIYNAIVNEIYIEYGMQPSENYVPSELLPDSQSGETTSSGKVFVSWIILIVLVLLYTSIFGRRGGLFIFGSPRFFTGGFHGGFGGFHGGSSGGFGGFSGGGGSFGGGGAGRKF